MPQKNNTANYEIKRLDHGWNYSRSDKRLENNRND